MQDSSGTSSPAHRSARWWRFSPLLLGVPLIVERALLVSRRAPTAADETLYLMQTLDWLGRFMKLSPDAHRTRGVSALLYPFVAFTDGVWVYRIFFAAGSIALCVIVYLIAREFMGRPAAAWAAVLFGSAATVLTSSLLLLPDLPAAVCIATAFLVYWRRVVRTPRDAPLSALWPIGLAIGAAFYFNIAFAAFAGASLGLDFLLFRRRDILSRAAAGAVVALGAVVGPYFVKVFIDHRNPFFTLRIGLRGTGRVGRGGERGYVEYIRWFWDPNHFFNRFWGTLVVVGVLTLVAALVTGRPIPRRHATLVAIWLVVPTMATAFTFHAEPRYLLPWLPAVFLTLALPVEAAAQLLARSGTGRRVGAAALAGLLLGGAIAFGITQYRPPAQTFDSRVVNFGTVHAAAERLGSTLAKPPCQVFGRHPREFALHTGCGAGYYNNRTEETLLRQARVRPEATFFVWWSGLAADTAYQPPYLTEFLRRYAVLAFTVHSRGYLQNGYVYAFYEPS